MDKQLQAAAMELIHTEHVITLAVAGNNQPWAAPVYYIYSGCCFWFFSSPASVHIKGAQPDGLAAASIYAASSGWKDIRGLQMTGTIKSSGSGAASIAAFAQYIRRFAFINELIGLPGSKQLNDRPGPEPEASRKEAHPEAGLNIKALEKAFRVKWYRFMPARAFYTDNRLAFGHREMVELNNKASIKEP